MGPYQPKQRDYLLTNDGMQERGLSSRHNQNVQSWGCLRNPIQHIDRLINAQTLQEVLENRLQLRTSIIAVKWLAKQAYAFRELIKHSVECSKEIAEVFLENAPLYAKYTLFDIQKELLNILANKVRNKIRKELRDVKFCILIDEALDEFNKEQMAIILRYVDWQVYDSASNMRGAWNGLQALFLKDSPYAYHIHCFAHQLQLALVAASNDVPDVWFLFSTLGSIVNVLTSFAKRISKLKSIWEAKIIDLIASGEVQTGIGANQIHTLQRPRATRWSSHFRSINKLLDLFSVVHKVLRKLVECGLNSSIRGEAKGACESMTSFKFVFILHLLNKFLGVSDLLCQALQVKSQDILNVVHLVSTTKKLLQRLLVETRKSHIYFLLDRLIRLVLALHVSTITAERTFSAIKPIKTTLRNKMENKFLSECMVIYIEREIADNIDSNAIIDECSFLKNRRTQLRQ
ncbi:hypothetical protein CISIN_1g036138mg [Citrus sinensis]|uniref:HAT C-terminal dimerisation domain-containing protein n=2 Tax=Citrus TaxID=2706 RepID=A0A067DCP9_CITSI|nr:hypothetical protein CISIN_1g036138mg [Citrus sinensis]